MGWVPIYQGVAHVGNGTIDEKIDQLPPSVRSALGLAPYARYTPAYVGTIPDSNNTIPEALDAIYALCSSFSVVFQQESAVPNSLRSFLNFCQRAGAGASNATALPATALTLLSRAGSRRPTLEGTVAPPPRALQPLPVVAPPPLASAAALAGVGADALTRASKQPPPPRNLTIASVGAGASKQLLPPRTLTIARVGPGASKQPPINRTIASVGVGASNHPPPPRNLTIANVLAGASKQPPPPRNLTIKDAINEAVGISGEMKATGTSTNARGDAAGALPVVLNLKLKSSAIGTNSGTSGGTSSGTTSGTSGVVLNSTSSGTPLTISDAVTITPLLEPRSEETGIQAGDQAARFGDAYMGQTNLTLEQAVAIKE